MENRYIYNLGLLFHTIAEKHPDRIAIKYQEGPTYSYTELNKRSNQLARYLLNHHIAKGDVVGILNNKSFEAYALMLACIKVGAVYSNFDFTNPWQRLSKILMNCQPKIIFNDHINHDLVSKIKAECNSNVENLFAEEFVFHINQLPSHNLEAEINNINGDDPLYIMFTSGSTGFPKGALMSHSNVINFIGWAQETFKITPDDVFTNANPIYFDNSVFDFYSSLFSGACLVPFSTEIVKDSRSLVKAVNDTNCTIWFSVPSLLIYLLTTKALKSIDFGSLTRISFGGEGFSKPKLKQLYDLFGTRIQLFNVYGPTECTCICSSYLINANDFENMNELAPLGHMAPNFGYEIIPLEERNKNIGELCLTGPNVGLGYYNDEERTSKSFIQNPYKKFFQRMYRTGDIVEKREDGYIYFKGRVDNQIKHMGYRIELEEIESGINVLKYVNETAVVYQRINTELGHILAFISVNESKDEKDILADLKGILAPYMLPKKITILDVLPKNKNGKIDRKQLVEFA
jgi:D-alanine--poly(phosphoribitol) ligase subunit 1